MDVLTKITPKTAERIRCIKRVYASSERTLLSISKRVSEESGERVTASVIDGIYRRYPEELEVYPLTGDADVIARRIVKAKKVAAEYAAKQAELADKIPSITDAPFLLPDGVEITPKHLMDRNDAKDCHWPVSGQGAGLLYCCAPVAPGRKYCPMHMAHFKPVSTIQPTGKPKRKKRAWA